MKRLDLLKLLYERLQLECEKEIPENEKDQKELLMDFMQRQTLFGMTALHYAASKNALDCARFLVVDCQVPCQVSKTKQGHFPVHRAVMAGADEALVQLLLQKDPLHPDKGINHMLLYTVDNEDNTLVHLAIDNGHVSLARYLASLEDEPKFSTMRNRAGQTPEDLAVSLKLFFS